MKWLPRYSTGVATIDNQHRMLFQMSEDFQAALETGHGAQVYEGLLRSLDLYARTHFGFEEGCMALYQCPAGQRNKDAHGRFMLMLADYQERLAASGFSHDDAVELMQRIDAWLVGHICTIDVQLKDSLPPE